MSIIEAGAHKTKLVSGDFLAEQLQSLWNGLSEELKQDYGGEEGLQRGNERDQVNETFVFRTAPLFQNCFLICIFPFSWQVCKT